MTDQSYQMLRLLLHRHGVDPDMALNKLNLPGLYDKEMAVLEHLQNLQRMLDEERKVSEQLRIERNKLTEELARSGRTPNLPDFVFAPHPGSFETLVTPVGKLFLRLLTSFPLNEYHMDNGAIGKFSIPGINIIDAYIDRNAVDLDKGAVVFVISHGSAMILHDNLHLFPSDALIVKLRMLSENR
jgi:hypothetical protein